MSTRYRYWMPLVLLAVIALSLRLMGLHWDQGMGLHPDERFVVWVTSDLRWPTSIGQYFNSTTSPLNPYNTGRDSFIYGTFPPFLVKAIASPFGMDSYSDLYTVGRVVGAVLDTGTIIITAILTRRFYGDRAGILAGLLLAFTPLFLQSAHFFTVDSISVFLVMAAFACVVRSWDRSSIGWMALAGTMIGLAGASKPNYLLSLGFLIFPVLELVRLEGWPALIPGSGTKKYPAIPAAIVGGFSAFWAFRVAQPYAFVGPHWWNLRPNPQWLNDLAFWRAVQVGLVDMKPSIQWIDRTPVVYILQNMVLWGMGVALGALALVALVRMCWNILRSERWPSWWHIGMVVWIIGSIVVFGTGIAQNQRYLMHIYPFLILYAAGLLIELQDRLPRAWMGQLLTVTVIVYTIVFGLAFDSLYTRPITRFSASEWIYQHVPDGAVISNEYWDDALPMRLPGQDPDRFTGMTLDLYADESQNDAKISTLVGQLTQIDYIVLSSNRIIYSVERQPERYPVANRFYDMLLDGSLGFEPVAEFRQGPEILGIEWDDRAAEESITVYEHPEVRIFRKTGRFDAQHVTSEFLQAWGYGGLYSIAGDPLPSQMLLSDARIAEQNTNGGWNGQVRSGWIPQHPVLSFWVAMQIVGIVAWPLTWRAMRNAPDLGWVLSKGIGLIGSAAIVLAFVSLRGMMFDRATISIALGMLAAIGIAARRCDWSEFRYKIRDRWRVILAGELVFTTVFIVMALVRGVAIVAPDRNLMQLTGVMRSVSLPPVDPWLSGGILHTHWAPLLPWSVMGRWLSLPPVVVYNLAIIGLSATLAGVVWSLLHTLTQSRWSFVFPVLMVLGSDFSFRAGLIPGLGSGSVDIGGYTAVLLSAILLRCLVETSLGRWVRYALLALIAGALMASTGMGPMLPVFLLAVGLIIGIWQQKLPTDAWWPSVRRLALELVGISIAGMVIWYPVIDAYTATQRNMVDPVLWGLTDLRQAFGLFVLVITIGIVATGTAKVLNQVRMEGLPGVIATFCTIVTIASAMVIGWQRNSALLLLLVISLLIIAAIWQWWQNHVLLWALAFLACATGFLLVVQTRPFHADLDGASQASQLIPIVWLLLILGLGLALTRALEKSVFRPVWIRTITIVSLVALMLIPTIDQLFLSRPQERHTLSAPAIAITTSELEAATWMQQNLAGFPVVLSADGALAAITGYPTLVGSTLTERYMRPGWQGLVQRREADMTTIYTDIGTWSMVEPLLTRYNIHYIVLGPAEQFRFGTGIQNGFHQSEEQGWLEKVFVNEGVVIYRVRAEVRP